MTKLTVYKVRIDGAFDGDVEIQVQDVLMSPIPTGYTRSSPHPIPDGKYAVMMGRWIYVNGEKPPLSPPYVPVPNEITMRQARLELLNIGKLNDVDAALASIPDDNQRLAAQIEWEYSAVVQRNAPLVQSLTPTLGLTEAEMDDLFRRAVLL